MPARRWSWAVASGSISSVLILWLAYALRRLFLSLVRRGLFLKQAILLCDHPDRAADLLRLLKNNPSSLYRIAGLVTCGAVPGLGLYRCLARIWAMPRTWSN